jgi:hypothetical protein
MTRNLLLTSLLSACTAFQLSAQAPPEPTGLGDIHCVIRDPRGLPVAATTVLARNVDGNSDRVALSGVSGAFELSDLTPGRYELTAKKDGSGVAPMAAIRLAARQSLDVDVTLSGNAVVPLQVADPSRSSRLLASAAPVPASAAAPDQAAVDPQAIAEELTALKKRITQLEAALETRTAVAAALPPAAPQSVQEPAPDSASQAGGKATTPPPAPPAASAHVLPEALEAPQAAPGVDNFTPFAFGDFTWLNGTPRNKDTVLDTKFFTPEVRFDTHFMEDFNQPKDHTMGGSTESFRSGEFQEEQISVGGDFHWQNVRGRVLYMMGLFATTTPRNDGSAGVGQWDLRNAYRYISEAWGGYHFNVNHGLNVDAGIFVSYIGLFSYYNFDNWTYQPSFVSSNKPWFFNGLRIQWFP